MSNADVQVRTQAGGPRASADLAATRRLHAVPMLVTLIGPVLAGIATCALRKSDWLQNQQIAVLIPVALVADARSRWRNAELAKIGVDLSVVLPRPAAADWLQTGRLCGDTPAHRPGISAEGQLAASPHSDARIRHQGRQSA